MLQTPDVLLLPTTKVARAIHHPFLTALRPASLPNVYVFSRHMSKVVISLYVLLLRITHRPLHSGGYLARTHDPPPGNTVIWRGLSRLTDIELGIMIGAQLVGN